MVNRRKTRGKICKKHQTIYAGNVKIWNYKMNSCAKITKKRRITTVNPSFFSTKNENKINTSDVLTFAQAKYRIKSTNTSDVL